MTYALITIAFLFFTRIFKIKLTNWQPLCGFIDDGTYAKPEKTQETFN